jgi:3-oxoacid CoA-transferase subunit A
MTKLVTSPSEAIADIESDSTIGIGGFGLCGIPMVLIRAVQVRGISNLTIISNNCGVDDWGAGILLQSRQVAKMISSYVGENKEFERQYLTGEISVELTPQGTLAEKLRAGGSGIGAFFTQTGVGTQVAEGGLPWRYASDGSVALSSPKKETRMIGDKEYVLEEAIATDFALIRAAKVDHAGNAVFHRAARNFNVVVAMAGRITICEAEEVVEVGSIDPDDVHLPGVYVHRIIALSQEDKTSKRIEKRTLRPRMEA